MAHTIEAGPLPNIVIITIEGDLSGSDNVTAEDLGFDQGPKYLMIDASRLNLGLPENLFSSARSTPVAHPNCLHVAVVVRSSLLKNAAIFATKIARVQHKIRIFNEYDEAMNHLVALAQQTESGSGSG
jgi:hypothetical protein